ncbi:MAG: MFS transporter [Clostridium sp.]|jgi:MFS family permease|nr:MFS transporter [Clostridium sp.]
MNIKIIRELREFLILWASQSVSTLGTAMTNFALIIWVYSQKGTASSIALLSVCSLLPSILFCFIAGTIADRWNKKRIMLLADTLAACGTVMVLVLYLTGALAIWHLYIINFLLSFMNAFQNPAAYVATSLLVPKEHYVRVSGLQSLSGSAVTIIAPALGSAALAFGGLGAVLAIDLLTFAVAFVTLLVFVKIPDVEQSVKEVQESFIKSCASGLRFLRGRSALLRIILFFAFINFIAKMGGYGMLPALVLSRTGGDQTALGIVESAVGFGTLFGAVLVTLMKPAKSRVRVIFIACGVSFLLGDVGQSLTSSLPIWVLAAFTSNVPMALLSANLTAVMRTNIPLELQGRVFAARDTIQYSTIPLGLFLGGVLADYVFEPLMAGRAIPVLSSIFGNGKGSGIAVMFFIVGAIGFVTSFLCLRNPAYYTLDKTRDKG